MPIYLWVYTWLKFSKVGVILSDLYDFMSKSLNKYTASN